MASLLDQFYDGYGGSLVGLFVTTVLLGVISIQSALYFQKFPKDSIIIKLAVVALWCIMVGEIGCFSYGMWWSLVQGFGNFIRTALGSWALTSYQTFTLASSSIVQVFFAIRVHRLSRKIWVTMMLIPFLLTLAREALFYYTLHWVLVAVVVASKIHHAPKEFAAKYTPLVIAWLSTEAAVDTVIAACMCILLWHRRTGFQETDSVIKRIMIYSSSTGLLTSIIALIILGVFTRKGFHFSVLVLALPFGGLYTIAMLTNLHVRSSLAERATVRGNWTFHMSNIISRKRGMHELSVDMATHMATQANHALSTQSDAYSHSSPSDGDLSDRLTNDSQTV